jgi:hypothetical protein
MIVPDGPRGAGPGIGKEWPDRAAKPLSTLESAGLKLWGNQPSAPAGSGNGECRLLKTDGDSLSKFNERSQEVIENKGDRFIANCYSQEVYESKAVILCKAKRLLGNKVVTFIQ